jgi:hypothetical protein
MGITFDKTIGGQEDEIGNAIKSTVDGGYIIVGSTKSSGNGSYDGYLVKTDSNGNIEWQKTSGGTSDDYFADVEQTGDGGYIVIGSNRSYNIYGAKNFWMLKFDKNGKEKWSVSYEDSSNVYIPSKIRITKDGGFIVIGSGKKSYESEINYAWLLRTDSTGELIWSKKFKDGVLCLGLDIILDSNYFGEIYTLLCYKNGNGYLDDTSTWLISVDIYGSVIYQKFIDISRIASMLQNSDGSIIMIGEENQNNYDGNLLIVKTYPGQGFYMDWMRSYGDSEFLQSGRYAALVSDGFVVLGFAQTEGLIEKFLLVKFDYSGNMIWERMYPNISSPYDKFGNIIRATDNGLIFTGTTNVNYASRKDDIAMIKTDENGNVIYPPAITSFVNDLNNVSIGWEAVSNAGSYIVYGSDRPDSNFTAIDTTTVNLWNSVAVDSLKKKFYFIKARTESIGK